MFSEVILGYGKDYLFGPIAQALYGSWPENTRERVKQEKLIAIFRMENERLPYNGRIWEPRKSVSTI